MYSAQALVADAGLGANGPAGRQVELPHIVNRNGAHRPGGRHLGGRIWPNRCRRWATQVNGDRPQQRPACGARWSDGGLEGGADPRREASQSDGRPGDTRGVRTHDSADRGTRGTSPGHSRGAVGRSTERFSPPGSWNIDINSGLSRRAPDGLAGARRPGRRNDNIPQHAATRRDRSATCTAAAAGVRRPSDARQEPPGTGPAPTCGRFGLVVG